MLWCLMGKMFTFLITWAIFFFAVHRYDWYFVFGFGVFQSSDECEWS